jgi:hypothetical protein
LKLNLAIARKLPQTCNIYNTHLASQTSFWSELHHSSQFLIGITSGNT